MDRIKFQSQRIKFISKIFIVSVAREFARVGSAGELTVNLTAFAVEGSLISN